MKGREHSEQIDSQLYSQLYSQLDSQIYSQLYSQLDSQLDSQLRSQLYSQLRSQLDSQPTVIIINKRWSPLVAMLLSFLIPGLGQIYKGQMINGIVWFLFVVAGYAALILPGIVLHLCCIVGAARGNPYQS